VAGTEWEIREAEHDVNGDGFEFVNIWSGEKFAETKYKQKGKMPRAVNVALTVSYTLQKRIWRPPKLSLAQRLRGEHQEHKQVQWWKRRHIDDDDAADDIIITFDPANGYVGPMPIDFDFSNMYGRRGCCRGQSRGGPTIKSIDDMSDQLDDGQTDHLAVGMKLLRINEDSSGMLIDLSVRDLVTLLNGCTEKITLRFQSVKVVHKMEDWATSQVMRNLTAGSLAHFELDILAQLLCDAGYTTKNDITSATHLSPRKLYHAIKSHRGKHRYRYTDKKHESQQRHRHDSTVASSAIGPARVHKTVMAMEYMEPICQMCTKTVASCNLSGGNVPEWCKPCAQAKLEGITAGREISKRLFYRFDTQGEDGNDKELDESELQPLIRQLSVVDWRGLKEEGIDTNDDGKANIHEFQAWFVQRQKRAALEARANECGVPEDQIDPEGWRRSFQKADLDADLINQVIKHSQCSDPHVLGEYMSPFRLCHSHLRFRNSDPLLSRRQVMMAASVHFRAASLATLF